MTRRVQLQARLSGGGRAVPPGNLWRPRQTETSLMTSRLLLASANSRGPKDAPLEPRSVRYWRTASGVCESPEGDDNKGLRWLIGQRWPGRTVSSVDCGFAGLRSTARQARVCGNSKTDKDHPMVLTALSRRHEWLQFQKRAQLVTAGIARES